MKTYIPNFSDPRVLSRITTAYGFSRATISETDPRMWSKTILDKHFGSQNHPLSKYLRDTLLICTDNHYSKGQKHTKKYILNVQGMDYIKQLLMGNVQGSFVNASGSSLSLSPLLYPSVALLFDQTMVSKWCMKEYGESLKTMSFDYKDKSNRLWHPLQSVRREYKDKVFADAGMNFKYDIECCAPTLIHQYSQQLGMDLHLFALCRYLKDKTTIRAGLAAELEVPVSVAKIIINALFCGARIGCNSQFAISQLLGNDKARVILLQEHPFINALRADIKTCWEYITPTLSRKSKKDKNGKDRMSPVNSTQKWSVYFELERKVLDSVRTYLSGTDNKHFLEHDGWITSQKIDEELLVGHIKNKTGLSVVLSSGSLSLSPLLYPSVALLFEGGLTEQKHWILQDSGGYLLNDSGIDHLKKLEKNIYV